MTDVIPLPFDLPSVERKKLTVDFGGGNQSSDAGLLLLRQAERKLGVCRRLADAISRLKEAVSEIKSAAKSDPVAAGDGAVSLMELIWPAFQDIDTSSGALGTAVARTLDELIPILIEAPSDHSARSKWLKRLFEAVQDDGSLPP